MCTILFNDGFLFYLEDFTCKHLPKEIIIDRKSFNFDDDTIRLINADNISKFRETLNEQGAGKILLTLKHIIGHVDDINVRESFRHYAECFKKKKFTELAKLCKPGTAFVTIDIEKLKKEVMHFKSYFDPLLDPIVIQMIRNYNGCIAENLAGEEYKYDTIVLKTMLNDIYRNLYVAFGDRLTVFNSII